jgi:hypothetical protein
MIWRRGILLVRNVAATIPGGYLMDLVTVTVVLPIAIPRPVVQLVQEVLVL